MSEREFTKVVVVVKEEVEFRLGAGTRDRDGGEAFNGELEKRGARVMADVSASNSVYSQSDRSQSLDPSRVVQRRRSRGAADCW